MELNWIKKALCPKAVHVSVCQKAIPKEAEKPSCTVLLVTANAVGGLDLQDMQLILNDILNTT